MHGTQAKLFRRAYSYSRTDVKVQFLGVWDTVGAIGIPLAVPVPKAIKRHWGFHDTGLSERVVNAHQALAIDERRRPFEPAIWTRDRKVEGQTLEQVWFAGAHRDVGGGTAEPSLSEIPLMWMVGRAQDAGLAFTPSHFSQRSFDDPESEGLRSERERALRIAERERANGASISRDPHGPMSDSFKGIYVLAGPKRRAIGRARGKEGGVDSEINGQYVADTAIERFDDEDATYRPRNLRDRGKRSNDVMAVMDARERTTWARRAVS